MTDKILKEIQRRISVLGDNCNCGDSENIPLGNHFLECPGYNIEGWDALSVAVVHIKHESVSLNPNDGCAKFCSGCEAEKEIAILLGVEE